MKFPNKNEYISPIKNARAFKIPFRGRDLIVIASIHDCIEHVSVSLKNRNPNWDEMCFIKDLFFDDEDECFQFHPKKSQYVNFHQYCLHIWKLPEDKNLTAILREYIEGNKNE